MVVTMKSKRAPQSLQNSCPCGSNRSYAQCCEPLHQGLVNAATAEALMRSRYSAYVLRLSELFSSGHSARERLMAYWQYLADTQKMDGSGEQKCLVVKLSAEVADLSESMRTALLDGYRRVIALIAQCMREGMTDGSLPARLFPELDAQNLYHLWLGASLANKLTKDGVPLSAAMRHTEQILAM